MRLPTPKFNVLLYGPGLPENGVRAIAHFEDGILAVHWRRHWFTIQADRISLRRGGYDGQQWLVDWRTPSGPVSMMLQSDDAARYLIEHAPPAVADRLKRTHQAHANRGWAYRLALKLALAAVLLVLTTLGLMRAFAEPLSGWAATRIAPSQEKLVGDRAFAALSPSLRLLGHGEATRAVELIGIRLTVGVAHRYVFHVVDDERVGALALPGGHIVLNTGLLRLAANAEEVAGLIAHLAAHVERRHALQRAIHALGWRAVLATALGDYQASAWGGMDAARADFRFTPEMEQAADIEALRLLRRAGVAADGLPALLARLAEADLAGAPYLLAHPIDERRLVMLRQALAEQGDYPRENLSIEWRGEAMPL